MKTMLWIGLGVLVVMALVVAGLTAGWALWGRGLWTSTPAYALDRGVLQENCWWRYRGRPGMMPGVAPPLGRSLPRVRRACLTEDPPSKLSDELTIEEAKEAVEDYLASQGYDGLEIAEVMAFENHFYAMIREHDTAIGAMELLIDRESGAVGPEMGPNMMWNARYGMHRGGMMDNSSGTNAVSPDEAVEIAQSWVDINQPGLTVDEHADPFYGYYTLHTREDGQIYGMLSVHGSTGQVWYHSWHGKFVQMIGESETH